MSNKLENLFDAKITFKSNNNWIMEVTIKITPAKMQITAAETDKVFAFFVKFSSSILTISFSFFMFNCPFIKIMVLP